MTWERLCKERGTDWNNMFISQGAPKVVGNYQKLE